MLSPDSMPQHPLISPPSRFDLKLEQTKKSNGQLYGLLAGQKNSPLTAMMINPVG